MTDNNTSAKNTLYITLGWVLLLFVLLALAYKAVFRQTGNKANECVEQIAKGRYSGTPLESVDRYVACLAAQPATAKAEHTGFMPLPRCAFAGTWYSTRDNVTYQITLDANGKFTAEPGVTAPDHARTITGAWAVYGDKMMWAYDSGATWPPDINPISARSSDAFTLTEVNGSTTRFTLVERSKAEICAGK